MLLCAIMGIDIFPVGSENYLEGWLRKFCIGIRNYNPYAPESQNVQSNESFFNIIEINKKCFELHGPGSLVLLGCPKHQYCKFPSFISYSSSNKESVSHKIVPNTSKFFTYLLLKNIYKGKSIRCFYGNQYEINENFVCERGNCVFNFNKFL